MVARLTARELTARLAAAGCVSAADEARELAEAAPDGATLAAWLARREAGEPLAWITGAAVFCGARIRVDPGVYVPRPHTELLARRAAAALAGGGRALDLCTGCGAVAASLAAAVPGACVLAIDADPRAVACARKNGVDAIVGDARRPPPGPFDVVTAVPPCVPTDEIRLLATDVRRHEPRLALDGGAGGLRLVRRMLPAAAGVLRPGGRLFLEVGGAQDAAVARMLAGCGFRGVESWCDEDGELRGMSAELGRG